MKKIIRMLSVIAAVVSLVLAMSVPSYALTDVKTAVSSGTTSVDTAEVVSSYDALIKKAYESNREMLVIEEDEMPEKVEVKYVQSSYGYCIKAYHDLSGKDSFDKTKIGRAHV